MISKDDFKLNINKDGGYYPTVYPDMIRTPVTGVTLGELLCPVPACVNEEDSISVYQHLIAAEYEHDSVDDPNFDHHRPDRAVISFRGECGHDWELRFESHKGYTEIQILNVENKAG